MTPPTLPDLGTAPLQLDAAGRLLTSSSSGTGTSSNQVQGNAAHDAVDIGNPVKVGGVYKASPTTVASGDRTDLLTDEYGQAKVVVVGTATMQGTAASNAAAVGNPVLVGAKYNLTTQTFDDGDVANLQADVNGNQKTSSATAFDEDIDSFTAYSKEYTYTKLSADGVVSAVPVGFCGYYISTSTTGIISFYDNASAASGDTLLATSKAVVTNDLVMLENPISMVNGLYFDLVSGSATVFIFTRKKVAA